MALFGTKGAHVTNVAFVEFNGLRKASHATQRGVMRLKQPYGVCACFEV